MKAKSEEALASSPPLVAAAQQMLTSGAGLIGEAYTSGISVARAESLLHEATSSIAGYPKADLEALLAPCISRGLSLYTSANFIQRAAMDILVRKQLARMISKSVASSKR